MTETEAERVLSLSECAELLHMKRPNVRKFLARRGVHPRFAKAQGYLWNEADVLRAKAEREADDERMAADRLRRRSALARVAGDAPEEPAVEVPRLGPAQRSVMEALFRRPVASSPENRHALLRLQKRGLAARVDGGRLFQLTDEGRRAAAEMFS